MIDLMSVMNIANGGYAEKNYSEAAEWFTLAANRGYYKAQHNLGHMYDEGVGVTQSYTEANFKTYLKEWMKKTAADSSDGFKIAYSYTTGTNRGSGMADTILSGTGDYQTFQAGGDDYRAQEFPNGTPSTANTYYLKIRKL